MHEQKLNFGKTVESLGSVVWNMQCLYTTNLVSKLNMGISGCLMHRQAPFFHTVIPTHSGYFLSLFSGVSLTFSPLSTWSTNPTATYLKNERNRQ